MMKKKTKLILINTKLIFKDFDLNNRESGRTSN